MKALYISADIEGVAGVVSWNQTRTDGYDWPAACRWMTNEVKAVCDVALDAGFDDIIVSDSHGTGENLIIDSFPEQVRVVRAWPRPLGMMQGVDEPEVEAAMLLGYHTAGHHARGVLSHTMHSGAIDALRLNGAPASETTVSMALAGHFGVPVVMATGDTDYCRYVDETYPGVATVAVKSACGRVSALSEHPARAARKIAEKARDVLSSSFAAEPFAVTSPVELEIRFKHAWSAELCDYLPEFERLSATRVSCRLADIVAVSKMLQFLTNYTPIQT